MKAVKLIGVPATVFLMMQAGTALAERSTGQIMDEVEWVQEIISLGSDAGGHAGMMDLAAMEVTRVNRVSGLAMDPEVSRAIDILSSD